MKFRAGRDLWLGSVIWGSIALMIWSVVRMVAGGDPVGAIIVSGIVLLLLSIWFRTYYEIKDGRFFITSGPYYKSIPIDRITSVRKTSNPFSSPSLTMRKLEIQFGTHGVVSVGPEDRDQLILALQEVNPEIEV
ncbi:MAG: PH domain-containing protein, partial [Bhargavaea sp.]